MKKTVTLLLVALLLACGNSQQVVVNNTLEVVMPLPGQSQTTFDTISVGRIYEGESIKTNFTLVNNDDKPLIVSDIITGCGCTTVDYDSSPIPAGGQRKMEIVFDSKGRYGLQLKAVDMISTDNRVARVFFLTDVINRE